MWTLIRARSQQLEPAARDSDNPDPQDSDASADRVAMADSGGDAAGTTVPAAFPAGRGGVVDMDDTPKWVLERLAAQRQSDSFLDGNEMGPAKRASLSTALHAATSAAGSALEGGGGGSAGAEAAAESFGGLARRAMSRHWSCPGVDDAASEAGSDRCGAVTNEEPACRVTDDALAGLRAEMERHAVALAALSRWMTWATAAAPVAGGRPPIAVGVNGDANQKRNYPTCSPTDDSPSQPAAPTVLDTRQDANPAEDGDDERHPPASATDRAGTGDGSSVEFGPPSEAENSGNGAAAAALQLSRRLDFLESSVRRQRFRAHRAVDEEIHRLPLMYKEACVLGNALILRGHDYLSQVKLCFS